MLRKLITRNVVRQKRLISTAARLYSCKSDDNPSASIDLCDAFQLYNLDESPESSVTLKRSEALHMYTEMQKIRRMEHVLAGLYRAKEVRGFCHLYTGQEACCVGMYASMRPMDSIITSYRSHGWTYVMGVSIRDIIAELMQKEMGCTRGKGGSMHTYGKNFYGGNGIVGAQVPLGTGVALAHAYRGDGGVNFAIYGDGAANQGQIFEAYNMACLWKLPVVFVCENNKYAMGTSVSRGSCSPTYFTRGDYIPGIWVNAMDILAVRSATEFVIKHATCKGPIVMELETYRYFGHSMSDPGISYRNREEVEQVRKSRDAIGNFRKLCMDKDLMKEDELKKIDDDIKIDVDLDVKECKEGKYPNLEELYYDVYLNNLEEKIRDTVYRNLKHKNVGFPIIPVGAPKPTPRSQIQFPKPPEPEPKKDGDGKPAAEGDGKAKEGASDPAAAKKDGDPAAAKKDGDPAAAKKDDGGDGAPKPSPPADAAKPPAPAPPKEPEKPAK